MLEGAGDFGDREALDLDRRRRAGDGDDCIRGPATETWDHVEPGMSGPHRPTVQVGPAGALETSNCDRVIAHLDLDCFYAQVERNRLGISPEVPLAVQQWTALIAGELTRKCTPVVVHLHDV